MVTEYRACVPVVGIPGLRGFANRGLIMMSVSYLKSAGPVSLPRAVWRLSGFGLVVAFVATLSACGSGGDDQAGVSPGLDQDVMGTVQIRFMRAPTEVESLFALAPMILADPSTVRIAIIHRPSGFRVVEDFPVPATVEANIPVPVADGYEVHGLSFVNDPQHPFSGRFLLLKHAVQEGIIVARNETTNVSLVLDEIQTELTFPAEVEGGQAFSVNMGEHPALRRFGYVYHQLEPIDTRYQDYNSYPAGSLTVTVNAPSVLEESDLYLITQRFVHDDFRKSGEGSSFWVPMLFYSPDVQRDHTPQSLKVTPPEGSIGIDVTY